MNLPRLVLACLIAVVCVVHPGDVAAQTTTARAESLEITRRADELLASGKYKRAAQRYRRAVEIDETNESAYVGLSSALDSLNRHDEALEILRTAQSLLGWTPGIGVQRGIHLTRLERWDDAVASLERALEARPRSFEAAYHLASAQLALENWDRAVDAFDSYLGTRPNALARRDSSVKTRRTYALLSAGEHQAAQRELESLLADDPGSLSARMLLFTALAKQGACDRALELYEDLQLAASVAPTLVYNAAACQFRTGDGRAALASLDAYGDSAEPPTLALLLRARIHASLGETNRAEHSYRDAIAAGVAAHSELARWLSELGKHAAVVELLWPLVADASDPEILELATTALVAESDFDRAVVAAARLIEVLPTPRSWTLQGAIFLQRTEWGAAEQSYTRALDAQPGHPQAGVGLRRALDHQATDAFRAEDLEAAHGLLTRALAADPSADDAAFNLGLLELTRGNPRRAIELVEPRVEGLSSPARGRLLLGRAHMQAGDAEAATRELEAIVNSERASPDLKSLALSHLAHALAQTSPDQAIKQIARARKLGPNSDATRAMLARAEAQAHLAQAERSYRRGSLTKLSAALKTVAVDQLAPEARVRVKLIELFAIGQSKGLSAALRSLTGLSDSELALVAPAELTANGLRHAIAIDLGAHFIERSPDYQRYLRSHAQALHPLAKRRSSLTARFLTRWYDRMLGWAISQRAQALALTLAKAAPAALRTPAFEHNAIIATAATKAGHKRLTKAQVSSLEHLTATIPEALVNLAIDADHRGDHAAVLGLLERIPVAQRTRDISQWLRWKERFHGSP